MAEKKIEPTDAEWALEMADYLNAVVGASPDQNLKKLGLDPDRLLLLSETLRQIMIQTTDRYGDKADGSTGVRFVAMLAFVAGWAHAHESMLGIRPGETNPRASS